MTSGSRARKIRCRHDWVWTQADLSFDCFRVEAHWPPGNPKIREVPGYTGKIYAPTPAAMASTDISGLNEASFVIWLSYRSREHCRTPCKSSAAVEIECRSQHRCSVGQSVLTAHAARFISANPLSSSCVRRRCAGISDIVISSVGHTFPARKWPPCAVPSDLPTTT